MRTERKRQDIARFFITEFYNRNNFQRRFPQTKHCNGEDAWGRPKFCGGGRLVPITHNQFHPSCNLNPRTIGMQSSESVFRHEIDQDKTTACQYWFKAEHWHLRDQNFNWLFIWRTLWQRASWKGSSFLSFTWFAVWCNCIIQTLSNERAQSLTFTGC